MTSLKTLLTVTATVALAVPALALADSPATPDASSSAQQCKTLRTQMGEQPFRDAYGTNKNKHNAFGKCVSVVGKARKAERKAAVDSCRSERTADTAAFTAKYGTGKHQKNAFGKCVSAQTKDDSADVSKDQRGAVKSCKTEFRADKAAFVAKYGTHKNKRNAFGKCVSAEAKAQAQARKHDKAGTSGPAATPQHDTNPGQSKMQSS